MRPPKREIEYEKVDTTDFLIGKIEDILYDQNHKSNYMGKEKIGPCVRFKFSIEGYQYHHYSRWMSFSYGEKSNLYRMYLVPLVVGAEPDMNFDLDVLKGMKIKMLWAEKNNFQFPETIRPFTKKIVLSDIAQPENVEELDYHEDEEFPEELK